MKLSASFLLYLSVITSFLVSFLVLPVLIKYSIKKNLVVMPGRRKVHKKITPSLGGVAIFTGFLFAVLLWLDLNDWTKVRYLVASLFIIFLVGIRDDLVPLTARRKMLGQIAAVVVVLFSDVKITSLYGLFNIYEIPTAVGYIITGLFIVFVTNAFNLIDGVDGLAGCIGIISLCAFGTWFHIVDQSLFSLLSFSMAGGMLAFLIFNWQPAEIFMGDTGAMVGGLLLSMLAIHFMNTNEALSEGHVVKFSSTIGAAACFIIVPLCDTTRIIILRLSKGQSPFAPDKSHIHHGLMRLGLTHGKTTVTLGVVSVFFLIASFLTKSLSIVYVLPGIVLVCTALSITLDRLLIKKLANRDQNQAG